MRSSEIPTLTNQNTQYKHTLRLYKFKLVALLASAFDTEEK